MMFAHLSLLCELFLGDHWSTGSVILSAYGLLCSAEQLFVNYLLILIPTCVDRYYFHPHFAGDKLQGRKVKKSAQGHTVTWGTVVQTQGV